MFWFVMFTDGGYCTGSFVCIMCLCCLFLVRYYVCWFLFNVLGVIMPYCYLLDLLLCALDFGLRWLFNLGVGLVLGLLCFTVVLGLKDGFSAFDLTCF